MVLSLLHLPPRVAAPSSSRSADRAPSKAHATRCCRTPWPAIAPWPPAPVWNGQTDKARVAVIQWSRCDAEATVVKVDFYDLEGQVEFDAYSSADGRMVFGIDGGLTMDRPAAASGASLPPRCVPPKQGSSRSGGGPGPAPVCMPAARMGLPAPDVSFSARTYFGEVHGFKTFSRIGTTEAVPIS